MGIGEIRSGSDAEGTIIEGLGIRRSLVEALTLKTLYYLGEASVQELSQQMCVSRSVIEAIFQRLRKDQLAQATGMTVGMHRMALTQSGRTRASELLGVDSYVGPVPVSLNDYVTRVRSQSVRDIEVNPAEMQFTFKDLVLEEGTLATLGTAVVSGRAIFLYGPAGTGKTSVAEKLSDLFRKDAIYIPYAVEVDGQIISVFDSHVHERIDDDAANTSFGDPRWVRCRRPRVMVGGELTIEMLDLQFNPLSRFYTAPVQMRGNNGFLIVDDFGRQRIPPADLLNRWVVPLDRRIDFLTLVGGKKLEIPFDLFVVFATNLDPALVVEEAFLRRIQTKIRLGAVSPQIFHEIFRRACDMMGLVYDQAQVDTVLHTIEERFRQPLRACYPRDLLHQIVWRARYEQREPELTAEALEHACQAYFLERDTPAKG